MRASLLPPKVARLVHANRASRLAVLAWRWRTMKAVRCPGHRGLAVVAQDEATFVHDAVAGVKCGSPVGVPVDVAHAESHARAVACGAIAEGRRRPFRIHGRFDAATLVVYLRRRFMRGGVEALPPEVRVEAQRRWLEESPYGRRAAVEHVIGDLKKILGSTVAPRRPGLVALEMARKAAIYSVAACPRPPAHAMQARRCGQPGLGDLACPEPLPAPAAFSSRLHAISPPRVKIRA